MGGGDAGGVRVGGSDVGGGTSGFKILRRLLLRSGSADAADSDVLKKLRMSTFPTSGGATTVLGLG